MYTVNIEMCQPQAHKDGSYIMLPSFWMHRHERFTSSGILEIIDLQLYKAHFHHFNCISELQLPQFTTCSTAVTVS